MKLRAVTIVILLIVSGATVSRADTRKDKNSQKVTRTMPADSAVTVTICVTSGNVTVQGWDKNEVRAQSDDAAQIELRRLDASGQTSRATRIEIVSIDKGEARKGVCQGFSDLALNVPRGANVQVQTRDGNIDIADVASAYTGTQNGDINIERASRSIEACTIGGSISLKDSSGRVKVNSAGGTLEASNLRPTEASDTFEAISVSGEITLDNVSHSQLTAKTVNGDMTLSGSLALHGRYGFSTMSGDVTLSLPADASFRLSANVSSNGEIVTDFPLTLTSESSSSAAPAASAHASAKASPPMPPAPVTPDPQSVPKPATAPKVKGTDTEPKVKVIKVTPVVVMPAYAVRRVNAVHGTGDALITVASFSGTLHLQKQ